MNGFDRLLIASDLSERAARAEERGASIGAGRDGTIIELLTVREKDEPKVLAQMMQDSVEAARGLATAHARHALEHRADLLKNVYNVDCRVNVRFGNPASEIVAVAEELDVDLIVIGAHGGNLFSDLILGNTVDKVVRVSRKPVLIVKNQPLQSYRHVLVAVDFTADSRAAAQSAYKLGAPIDLSLLHVFSVPFEGQMQYANISTESINSYRAQAYEDARNRLNAFAKEIGIPEDRLHRMIEFGNVGPVVRHRAKTHQPDLIAVGKHGENMIAEFILGSATRDAIEQTDCDVLVVRAEAGAR